MVVIINGMPRAGKDLFVSKCATIMPDRVLNISTVDFVKHLAAECGWDGTKDAKNRKFLSDLKDLLTKWDDVPLKKVVHETQKFEKAMESYDFGPNEYVVFIHCREPQEIDKLKDALNAKTLLVRRAAIEENEQSNHADAQVFDYRYDCTIHNDGTVDDLYHIAELFLRSMNIKI